MINNMNIKEAMTISLDDYLPNIPEFVTGNKKSSR